MVPAQSNPYQSLLADALRAQGVDVTIGQGPTSRPVSPLLLAWARARFPRVLHLHWVHRFEQPLLGREDLGRRRTIAEMRILRRLGVRIVWTLHNIGDHEQGRGRPEMAFHRRLVELVDVVICHCDASRRLAVEAYDLPAALRPRLHVVAHGNYAGAYPDTIGRDAARAELGLGATDRVFLFIGQIRPYKGVEELLEVFARIAAPDSRLVIAGKPLRGTTGIALERLAEQDPRVVLALQMIPDARMQVYLRAADAAVLPYRDVLTSGSAILAMSFGLPVIAPAIGCLPETLGSDGTILYDPAASDGLARALDRAGTEDLGMLGGRAAAHAATLDWAAIATTTAALYRRSGQT